MLSEDVLFGLMKNHLYPSSDFISYLLDVPEKKTIFEEQFRKFLHSSNLEIKDAKLLIEVYERQAKKYYQERNQVITEVIATNSSEDKRDKKKQEIVKISPTDISNVIIYKNYQFDLFALEFPIFSLKLDKRALNYQFTSRSGTTITIHSTKIGRATMQDADLWLYCITKMMQLIYEEKTLTRRITFTSYDYLKETKRKPTGTNYKQIINSLRRLKETVLETNKTVETWEVGAGLGLIDSYGYVKDKKSGKIIKIEVVLPEWLYCYVINKKVATIDSRYLELKPLEKRIYQLAKIHCRRDLLNTEFTLDYFSKKVGSFSTLELFRFKVKKIQEKQPLPGFLINYDKEKDKIWFTLREQKKDTSYSFVPFSIRSSEKENTKKDENDEEKSNTPDNEIEKVLDLQNYVKKKHGDKTYTLLKNKGILSNDALVSYLINFPLEYIKEKFSEFLKADLLSKYVSENKSPSGIFGEFLYSSFCSNNKKT